VKLTAYDAVSAPNPLVADSHEIELQIQHGALAVTETLWINNPSLTTYVGESGDGAPMTLSLSIPDGFERVTFHDEFNGRHFKLRDNLLYTDIPWTPGKREVKFSYLLPVEDTKLMLEWSVSLPCTRYRLSVRGENADRFECNLPRVAGQEPGTVVYESSEQVPAGHTLTVQLGQLPAPWTVHLRWLALAVLVGLIALTAGYRIRRRLSSKPDTSLPQKSKA
jgi:hypothetical protein